LFEQIVKAFGIPELRKRALFTLGAIIVFRIGTHIPVPGVDVEALQDFFQQFLGGGIFQFLNMFAGGALQRFSLFALGVIPYINASIIMSLLTAVIPTLKELQQQGDEGRRVINKYTRYGTVGLAFVQALGISYMLTSQGIASFSMGFYLISVTSLVTGTLFLMWLGERITENGIGRGISMIIMIGIVSRFPSQISDTYFLISTGSVNPFWTFVLVGVLIVVVAGIVMIQLGARRINVQYAKRVVKGKVYGGQSTYIPLKVNQGGVIPIIFASALLQLPTFFIRFLPGLEWLQTYVQQGSPYYLMGYAALIIFFTYFYSSIVFDPKDLAKNLKEWGGFIPGIRPGRPTSGYISRVINRLILIGALFLAAIALLPYILIGIIGNPSLSLTFALGGTSILIVVGVGIDTIQQIEAHMAERHYEKLVEKGRGGLGRRM
jgi:preprotein translocase subunit SecY